MIFLGIKYEPLSDPPVIKICEWGSWVSCMAYFVDFVLILCLVVLLLLFFLSYMICNRNKTEWSPVRSVLITTSEKQNWMSAKRESNFSRVMNTCIIIQVVSEGYRIV